MVVKMPTVIRVVKKLGLVCSYQCFRKYITSFRTTHHHNPENHYQQVNFFLYKIRFFFYLM
jgi:hypothetical protein